MKEKDIASVFIIPIRKRKDLGGVSENSDDIVAACPEPKTGRNATNGAVNDAAIEDLIISFFVRKMFFIFFISCFGREILLLRDKRMDEAPKRPERRGRRGSLTGRFRVRYPRKPAKINIVREAIKFSSLNIM